jgi:tetratricopeptide (TPR) repeat protein
MRCGSGGSSRKTESRHSMWSKSFGIGRFRGIDIRVHWSLPLAFIYFLGVGRWPQSLESWIFITFLITCLFGFILLHELGHVFTARRYGIISQQIVLWPLGGFAQFDRLPAAWTQRILLFAAGPLANVGLAGLAFTLRIALMTLFGSEWENMLYDHALIDYLDRTLDFAIDINLSLAVGNLIPIYPLDGGRIAREVLQRAAGSGWSDRIMVMVSVPAAIGMFAYGIWFNRGPLWSLTSVLLALAAGFLHPGIRRWIIMVVSAVTERGLFHFMRGDFSRSVAAYDRLIARNPGHQRAHHNRAVALQRLGQYEQALAGYTRAIELNPNSATSYVELASLYGTLKRYDDALAACAQALDRAPQDTGALTMRASISLRAGDFERALRDCDAVIQFDSVNPEAHILRSAIWLLLDELGRARSDVELLIYHHPHDPRGYSSRGYILIYDGDDVGARADFERALRIDPHMAIAYVNRGLIDARCGKRESALADFATALRFDPSMADAHYGRAWLHYGSGDYAQARTDLDAALAIAEEEVLISSELWLLRHFVGCLDWALFLYDHALDRNPQSALAYRGRADAYRVNRLFDNALADYDQALAITPGDAEAYYGRALVAYARDDVAQAAGDLQLALDRSPPFRVRYRVERLAKQLEHAMVAVQA